MQNENEFMDKIRSNLKRQLSFLDRNEEDSQDNQVKDFKDLVW